MSISPKPTDVRAFVTRRWDMVDRAKLDFLADRFRTGGPLLARAAALRLFQRWRALHPRVSPERCAQDLASHVDLKRKLDQTRDAFRGR